MSEPPHNLNHRGRHIHTALGRKKNVNPSSTRPLTSVQGLAGAQRLEGVNPTHLTKDVVSRRPTDDWVGLTEAMGPDRPTFGDIAEADMAIKSSEEVTATQRKGVDVADLDDVSTHNRSVAELAQSIEPHLTSVLSGLNAGSDFPSCLRGRYAEDCFSSMYWPSQPTLETSSLQVISYFCMSLKGMYSASLIL